jgi:hypothetical protein
VWRSGSALKIELETAQVSRIWGPPNGFDHVAFTLFFSQPRRADGVAKMPLQQARLPGDARWQHRLRLTGWSNALFSAEGADADHEGRPPAPAQRWRSGWRSTASASPCPPGRWAPRPTWPA